VFLRLEHIFVDANKLQDASAQDKYVKNTVKPRLFGADAVQDSTECVAESSQENI
jgi:hypothetical protein